MIDFVDKRNDTFPHCFMEPETILRAVIKALAAPDAGTVPAVVAL